MCLYGTLRKYAYHRSKHNNSYFIHYFYAFSISCAKFNNCPNIDFRKTLMYDSEPNRERHHMLIPNYVDCASSWTYVRFKAFEEHFFPILPTYFAPFPRYTKIKPYKALWRHMLKQTNMRRSVLGTIFTYHIAVSQYCTCLVKTSIWYLLIFWSACPVQ